MASLRIGRSGRLVCPCGWPKGTASPVGAQSSKFRLPQWGPTKRCARTCAQLPLIPRLTPLSGQSGFHIGDPAAVWRHIEAAGGHCGRPPHGRTVTTAVVARNDSGGWLSCAGRGVAGMLAAQAVPCASTPWACHPDCFVSPPRRRPSLPTSCCSRGIPHVRRRSSPSQCSMSVPLTP